MDARLNEAVTEASPSGAPAAPAADAADAAAVEAPQGVEAVADTQAGDDVDLRERILEALKNVEDPELGINIVDLGLVYGVQVQADTVHITYTLTTMGCPIGPLIEAEIKQFLSGVDGVENVDAEMVLRPPWTPEMMSDEAKAALGFF